MTDEKDPKRDEYSPEYEPTIGDICDNVWATVEYWEMRVGALYFATQNLARYDKDNVFANAYSVVHNEIYKELINAYRNLFMMGHFMDEEQRQRVKKKAYDRFMKEGSAMMYLLSSTGEHPSRYWSEVEKRLRHLMQSRL